MVLKKNNKEHEVIFVYRTITFYGIPFQEILTNQTPSKCSPSGLLPTLFPYNPLRLDTRYLAQNKPPFIFEDSS